MAENRLVEVAGHWLPRIEVAGIPSSTARAVMERAQSWPNWCRTWVEEGERHAAIAANAEKTGHTVTAGEAYVRAALCNHFAQFMFFDDLSQKAAAAKTKLHYYAKAAPHLSPRAEALQIPFEGGTLKAYRRTPKDAQGLVVLIPGSDSTKEEFCALEHHMLVRGLETVSVDGPGQGEGRDFGPLRADIADALAAVIAATGQSRVGVLGMAFGGHLALRAAATLDTVAAVVSVNGFHDLGAMWEAFPPVYRDNMRYALGAKTAEDAKARAKSFTLSATAPPAAPALILHGGLDKIFPVAEAEAQASWAGERATLKIFPDGNHVCNNIPWAYRPLAADWLKDQIANGS